MAARTLNKLTDLVVRRAKAPGWYGDGGGLYLRITGDGSRRWVFVFQWNKERAEMGLGSVADVSLPEARGERDRVRKLVKAGVNPIEERRQAEAMRATEEARRGARQTFGEWAEAIAPQIGPEAAKARKAWVSMMTEKVGPLASVPPADVTTEHVLKAIGPYWLSRPESGRRMRQRIEKVLDAARSKGLIPEPTWQNPARLKGHLENLLPRRAKVVKHRKALPYEGAPAFMRDLRKVDRLSARALEFVILGAVRNIEGRGARVGEIDRKERLWTIPAERMKGPKELRVSHRVPLTDRMLAILDEVVPPDAKPTDLIFPCPAARSGMYSENALQNVLNDMGLKGKATVHGFRSTFKDWAADRTNFANEISEAALAHKIEDDTERAYRRGDALLKRRKLMEAWAGYLAQPPREDNVRPLSRPA